MSDVPPLLRPFELRGRRLRNRIVFGPHETNLARRRAISRRHLAYYTRRARGGAGLIVTESASVHPYDWPYERAPLAQDCEPGWRAVASACHEEGALVLAGLSHAGSQGSSAYSQRELWAPSSVPDVASREVPKEMEPEDVTAVVAGFASAAALAIECGLDGVEINAGQHSLVRQFLSGLTNLRTDAYGERARFAEEVLAAVRAAAPDAVIGLRLSCDELAPWAGITPSPPRSSRSCSRRTWTTWRWSAAPPWAPPRLVPTGTPVPASTSTWRAPSGPRCALPDRPWPSSRRARSSTSTRPRRRWTTPPTWWR